MNLYNLECVGLHKEVSIKSQRRWSLTWIHIYRNLSEFSLIARLRQVYTAKPVRHILLRKASHKLQLQKQRLQQSCFVCIHTFHEEGRDGTDVRKRVLART